MKKYIRIFNALVKNGFINPDDFYTTSITRYGISFQGYYDPKTIKFYMNKRFNFSIDEISGYLEAERHGIKITLTDK